MTQSPNEDSPTELTLLRRPAFLDLVTWGLGCYQVLLVFLSNIIGTKWYGTLSFLETVTQAIHLLFFKSHTSLVSDLTLIRCERQSNGSSHCVFLWISEWLCLHCQASFRLSTLEWLTSPWWREAVYGWPWLACRPSNRATDWHGHRRLLLGLCWFRRMPSFDYYLCWLPGENNQTLYWHQRCSMILLMTRTTRKVSRSSWLTVWPKTILVSVS